MKDHTVPKKYTITISQLNFLMLKNPAFLECHKFKVLSKCTMRFLCQDWNQRSFVFLSAFHLPVCLSLTGESYGIYLSQTSEFLLSLLISNYEPRITCSVRCHKSWVLHLHEHTGQEFKTWKRLCRLGIDAPLVTKVQVLALKFLLSWKSLSLKQSEMFGCPTPISQELEGQSPDPMIFQHKKVSKPKTS